MREAQGYRAWYEAEPRMGKLHPNWETDNF